MEEFFKDQGVEDFVIYEFEIEDFIKNIDKSGDGLI